MLFLHLHLLGVRLVVVIDICRVAVRREIDEQLFFLLDLLRGLVETTGQILQIGLEGFFLIILDRL